MAFVEGQTVKEKLRESPFPLDEALSIALQVAQGQEHPHFYLHLPDEICRNASAEVAWDVSGCAQSRLGSGKGVEEVGEEVFVGSLAGLIPAASGCRMWR
jgi:hypothetical protein